MANSETGERKTSLRDNLVFYSTAFFCLVAIFSLFIFLFLVPFFIEPALATIYMEFHPEPTICQTTEANQFKGLSKCQWSSCREGCTKEVYECWHIRVRYLSPVPVGQADSRSVRDRIAQDKLSSSTSLSTLRPVNYKNINLNSVKGPQSSNAFAAPSEDKEITTMSSINENRIQSVLPEDDDESGKEDESEKYTLADEGGNGLHVHEARLQPNVKGCGYPPDVECNATFIPTYGVVGANFSCYYSLIDPTLAITQLNIEKVRAELIYCLTIPIILFVISVGYLFYAYFKLFPELPENTMHLGKSSQDFQGKKGENDESVVTSQPINSPSRMGGKYGQLFQCPSPDNSLKTASRVVRRSKSGGAVTFSSTQKSSQEQTTNDIGYEDRSTNLAGGVANRGMRTSKSMGLQGESSLADNDQRRSTHPDSASYSSSASNSSSSSSSSLSCPSSSRPASRSSYSSFENCKETKFAFNFADGETGRGRDIPARNRNRNRVITIRNQSKSPSTRKVEFERHRPRECIPLIRQ